MKIAPMRNVEPTVASLSFTTPGGGAHSGFERFGAGGASASDKPLGVELDGGAETAGPEVLGAGFVVDGGSHAALLAIAAGWVCLASGAIAGAVVGFAESV